MRTIRARLERLEAAAREYQTRTVEGDRPALQALGMCDLNQRPELEFVTPEDCPDPETYRGIRETVCYARGDFATA